VVLLAFIAGCQFDLPDVPAICGDGLVDEQLGEQCDDGNDISGDGCDRNCTRTGCGNGIPSYPEECDAGSFNSNNGICLKNCHKARCGDGYLWLDEEECDDGNWVTERCPPGQACTVCGEACRFVSGLPG
jgi:cysteine-rich repeat protein